MLLAICLFLNLTGCMGKEEDAGVTGEPEKPSQQKLQQEALETAGEIVKSLTLEEKIGQMFLVDVDKLVKGNEPVTEISSELLGTIGKYKLGGIVFGKQDIESAEQIRTLIGEIKQSVSASADMLVPLYIGTEEEGGGENSIAAATDTIKSTGYVSPSEMGKNMTESQLENTGEVIGRELADLGFNLNFAPVADLREEAQPVDEAKVADSVRALIGEKPQAPNPSGKKWSKRKKKKKWKTYQKKLKEYESKYKACLRKYEEEYYNESCFGEDADQVGDAVAAIVQGMHVVGDNGICTVLKMFPGISSVASFHKLTNREINKGLSRFRRSNLPPFSAGIEAGTDFIMVGHVTVSKVDQDAPASLSRTVVTDMLRSEMRFDGVIVTEQMDVPVITGKYTAGEAAVQAILAGADMIYNPQHLEEAISSVERAVASGKIEEEAIDQAVLRILQNKLLRGICEGAAVYKYEEDVSEWR